MEVEALDGLPGLRTAAWTQANGGEVPARRALNKLLGARGNEARGAQGARV